MSGWPINKEWAVQGGARDTAGGGGEKIARLSRRNKFFFKPNETCLFLEVDHQNEFIKFVNGQNTTHLNIIFRCKLKKKIKYYLDLKWGGPKCVRTIFNNKRIICGWEHKQTNVNLKNFKKPNQNIYM